MKKIWKTIQPLIVFAGCMVVATAIELATSYILEAITGAWPWQTYVDYAINFQGRVALSPSVRFGLGGLLFLYVLQPLFERLVGLLSQETLNRVSTVLAILFVLDCAVTAII